VTKEPHHLGIGKAVRFVPHRTLHEHRSAFITAAVTGQIDVREAA